MPDHESNRANARSSPFLHPVPSPAIGYAIAVIAVVFGWLVRLPLAAWVGDGLLPTYITFYPAVIVAAFLGGLGPGLLATGLAALIVVYWLPALTVGPPPPWHLVIFLIAGVLTAIGAERYRRMRAKTAAYDQERVARSVLVQAEQALHASEARYRLLVEQAPDGIFVADAMGNYVDVNLAGTQMLGYTRNEILSMNIQDLIFPEERDRLPEEIARFAHGAVVTSEWRFRCKDGSERIGEVVGRQLPDGRLQGVLRDITQRRQAERALRDGDERLRAHVENSPMAVVGWDSEFIVTQWAGEAERMFGWSATEVIGKPIMDLKLIFEEDLPLVEQAMAKISAGTSRYVISSNRNITKAGRVIHCVWHNTVLTDANGRMASILSLVQDVTPQVQADQEMRAAKAEAERANRAKSQFLAAASHDLRQPLSALSLYMGALESKLAPDDIALSTNMKNCVANLSDMLTKLLDLSKLEAGVVTPNVSDFSLDTLIAHTVSTQRPNASAKGLALRNACFGLIARTDAVLFQRIIENFVANAIRYTERGGVLIGCRRRQGKVSVEVWDTGIGIPTDQTVEIFEEFKQLGNHERNQAKGTGLGLAIVAKTATLLGLEIRVRSRLGKGSVFTVEVPLGEAVQPIVRRPYTHRPLRIALVEDNAEVAMALAYALTHVGHQVICASSGPEILPRLNGTAPDIVISDYRLAGNETGFEVIATIRAVFGRTLPALIITGDTDPFVIRRMAAERIRVQHKPFDIEALRSRIADLTADAG